MLLNDLKMKCMCIDKQVKRYFKKLGYSVGTIEGFLKAWILFESWLNLQPFKLSYKAVRGSDVSEFQNWLYKDQNKNIKQVNVLVNSIRQVYNVLVANNLVKSNPALNISMEGAIKKAIPPAVPVESLESLYESYPESTPTEIKEKVILGLMIYQGLSSKDIVQLTMNSIDMKKGKLTTKRTKKSNERILSIEFVQFSCLQKYIAEVRPELLKYQKGSAEAFILASMGSTNSHNLFANLKEKVCRIESKLLNLAHIRSSVIIHWCKQNPNDLVKVQYLAGHRYISSTEKYLESDTLDLSEKLNKYFPLSL